MFWRCFHKQVSLNFSGFDRGAYFTKGQQLAQNLLTIECEFRRKRVGFHTELTFLVMAASRF